MNRFRIAAVLVLLLALYAGGMVVLTLRNGVNETCPAAAPLAAATEDPIVLRAERELRESMRGKLSYLQRNAVVVNFTVRIGRQPGRHASALYFRDPATPSGWRLSGVSLYG